jgi:uncharacterized membrane protein
MFNTHITEKIPRSVAKMISWRFLIVLQYFFIGYFTTGSLAFGLGLAGFTTLVNSTLYFFHERAWNKTDWDRTITEPKLPEKE